MADALIRARVGTITKLALFIVAPGPERAVLPNGDHMVGPRRDVPPVSAARHENRTELPAGRAIAELAVIISAPSPKRAIAVQSQHKAFPCREANPARAGTYALGKELVRRTASPRPKLSLLVGPPTPEGTITLEGEGIAVTDSDALPRAVQADLYGRQVICSGSVAKLPIAVGAPSPKGTIRMHRRRVGVRSSYPRLPYLGVNSGEN
jgi:hypothetical protein